MRTKSHPRMGLTAAAVVLAAALVGSVVPAPSASADTVAIQIDPTHRFQTVQGWGTSLAWWANVLGGWSSTNKSAVENLLFSPTSGLGLNIARYNIGAGTNPDPNKDMRVGAEVPTFEPSSGTWDWSADANQRSILSDAQTLGVNTVEAFVNAPPAWMTTYACTAGAPDGSANLPSSNYTTFANYVATIAKHFNDSWGTTFTSVSPFNEPSSAWWKCSNNQEGNHVNQADQPTIIDDVYSALRAQGLPTGVIAGEGYSPADSLASWDATSSTIQHEVVKINTHTYSGTGDDPKLRVAARTSGTALWDSELGVGGTAGSVDHNDITSALQLADEITSDFTQLQADAFVYWQAVEDAAGDNNYGFLKADFTGDENYWVTKQYYAMKNYSRYIKPGSIVLQSNDGSTLAAWNPSDNSLTLVVHNDATSSRSLTYDLSKFGAVGSSATRVETSPANNAATLSPVTISGGQLSATLPAQSITSFVVGGVSLPSSGTNLITDGDFESTPALNGWTADWNPSLAGVETSYPAGGTHDAYLHPTSTQDVGLSQSFTASTSGHYSFTVNAATNIPLGVQVGLDVGGNEVDSRAIVGDVGYRRYELNAQVDAGQTVKLWYYAPKISGWATLDSVSGSVSGTLLANSGFEKGLTNWSADWHPARVTAETNFPFSGAKDGALNNAAGNDSGLSQTVTAPSTGTYTLTAETAANTADAELGVDVAGTQQALVHTVANDGYHTQTLTFTASAGQTIKVWYYMPGEANWATIDDVLLTH